MLKVKNFFKDSYVEMMQHVTWSPFRELQESSVLVLIASLIFALIIGLIDIVFKNGLDIFYTTFN